MAPPIHVPPPILDFGRWLAACIANFVHLKHAATRAAEAPVPPAVGTSLQTQPIRNWGELADVASAAAMSGITQMVEAMVAHPFGTIALLWGVYETVHQLRKLVGWFRRKRPARRKRPGPTTRASRKGTDRPRRPRVEEPDPPAVGDAGNGKAPESEDRVAADPVPDPHER